jgi:acyl-CoA thioesterase I
VSPGGRARWTRLAGAALLGGAAVALWLGWSSGGLARLDPTRRSVVFLGNSITAGDGVTPEVTFPRRLATALAVPVQNAGISGDTTWRALGRLSADVLAHRPRLVVVELGVNDAVDYHRPPEETLRNLREIARRLRKAGARVVLVYTPFDEFGHDAYRLGLRRIAERERARFIEHFYDGIVPGLTVDGIHPTPEGHALLADRLEPLLRELLGR